VPRAKPSTDRGVFVAVHMTVEDKLRVEERAKRAGMSMSGYSRAAMLGRSITVAGAAELVLLLAEANEALHGLSVLLRYTLQQPELASIEKALGEIDGLQERLALAAERL
jgi:hypothetical protein